MDISNDYNLFLDDIRDPVECMYYTTAQMPQDKTIYTKKSWTVVRDYDQFVNVITERLKHGSFPAVISFDHDLADEHYAPQEYYHDYNKFQSDNPFKEKTGKECADWLVQLCIDEELELPATYVHSMNPHGLSRIVESIKDLQRYRSRN